MTDLDEDEMREAWNEAVSRKPRKSDWVWSALHSGRPITVKQTIWRKVKHWVREMEERYGDDD